MDGGGGTKWMRDEGLEPTPIPSQREGNRSPLLASPLGEGLKASPPALSLERELKKIEEDKRHLRVKHTSFNSKSWIKD